MWFYRGVAGWIDSNKNLLWFSVFMLPTPWIAIEAGWFIAEFGRQPWVVEGVLPTFYAASGLTVLDLVLSLGFFVLLYTTPLGDHGHADDPGGQSRTEGQAVAGRRRGRFRHGSPPQYPSNPGARIMSSLPLDYQTLRLIWWLLLGCY